MSGPKPNPPIVNFMSHVEPIPEGNGCWEWTGCQDANGYGRFCLKGQRRLASRVSWMLHNGAIPEGLFVCHKCDNPPCVNPAHLFLGTAKDNMQDCKRKGRMRHERKHSDEKLAEALALIASGVSQTHVARKFGISGGFLSTFRRYGLRSFTQIAVGARLKYVPERKTSCIHGHTNYRILKSGAAAGRQYCYTCSQLRLRVARGKTQSFVKGVRAKEAANG
jgi:hypothetical protein